VTTFVFVDFQVQLPFVHGAISLKVFQSSASLTMLTIVKCFIRLSQVNFLSIVIDR